MRFLFFSTGLVSGLRPVKDRLRRFSLHGAQPGCIFCLRFGILFPAHGFRPRHCGIIGFCPVNPGLRSMYPYFRLARFPCFDSARRHSLTCGQRLFRPALNRCRLHATGKCNGSGIRSSLPGDHRTFRSLLLHWHRLQLFLSQNDLMHITAAGILGTQQSLIKRDTGFSSVHPQYLPVFLLFRSQTPFCGLLFPLFLLGLPAGTLFFPAPHPALFLLCPALFCHLPASLNPFFLIKTTFFRHFPSSFRIFPGQLAHSASSALNTVQQRFFRQQNQADHNTKQDYQNRSYGLQVPL